MSVRIVALADTHTFQEDLVVPAGDLFIHAGDLLRVGTLDELTDVARWINGLPHRFKVVVAGNHDWVFLRDRQAAVETLGPRVLYLQDQPALVAGLKLSGSPWQPEFNAWAFNLPRGEALAERWALIPARTDVLITHGPPRGFGDRSEVGRREGCDDLLEAVDRVEPLLHLFGHIHQDGGVWTRGPTCLANVTTCEGQRQPTVIDVDVAASRAVPISVPPARRAS